MHRYTGLLLAVVLFVAGLTGSLCAFQDELDAVLNPDLFQAQHAEQHQPLSFFLDRLHAQHPAAQVTALVYRPPAGRAVEAFASEVVPGSKEAVENEYFLDPSNGQIQGVRPTQGCCFNRRALMSFLYRVHYSLDLGPTGIVIMGICAILWSIDCCVGILLTFPLHQPVWREEFWKRWGKSWLVAIGKSVFRLIFDLHRAVSLWLWVVFLGIAISGVALTLPTQVFNPVVHAVLPTAPALTRLSTGRNAHAVTPDEAEALVEDFVHAEGTMQNPSGVLLAPDGSTATFYLFSKTGKQVAGLGSPVVTVDLKTGSITDSDIPGKGRLGNLVLQIQFPWHSGELAGLAGRIVICASGLALCLLTVTGVMIWWRKRWPPRRKLAPIQKPLA